jgi:threonine/homoserine/homoserine lactone efflux protein
MPPASTMLPFVAAILVMLITPGPVVMYIITRSTERGRIAALVSVLGVGLASVVHVSVAVFGIAGLLAASPVAFRVIQYAGAGWLVWLGIRAFRAGGENAAVVAGNVTGNAASLAGAFAEGFTVNILNPKAPLFFIAFLPQFVDPTNGDVKTQVAWLGATFAALGMVTDSSWAMVAHTAGRWLAQHQSIWRNRHYVTGSVLCGLGLVAALAALRQ